MRAQVCYTIGHSNHTIEKFVGLLRRHKIAYLIDVRSSPYSQHVPQFNKEVLDKELKKAGIKYLPATNFNPSFMFHTPVLPTGTYTFCVSVWASGGTTSMPANYPCQFVVKGY